VKGGVEEKLVCLKTKIIHFVNVEMIVHKKRCESRVFFVNLPPFGEYALTTCAVTCAIFTKIIW
jgi:hypothetical protein